MIKFRQKEYSIKDGYYTGPKDNEKTPGAISTMVKGAGLGALLGAVVGKVAHVKDEDYSLLSGAWEGAKYGSVGGLLWKVFLNYLHNPMKSVKYQEVDKHLRREFGVFRMAGVTVGDSVGKRASIEEKFGFNDRNVTAYKLTFSISDNKVTMYTLGMTESELMKVDRVLDYYCKKFSGMGYTSMAINEKVNSYAVVITFTNYQIISNFIMELSNELETKINLLDNDMIAKGRIQESIAEEEPRNFSIAGIGKDDIPRILTTSGKLFVSGLRRIGFGLKKSLCYLAISMIYGIVSTMNEKDLAKSGIKVPRFVFGNDYLKEALKRLGWIEGFHYTVGEESAEANMSLVGGILLLTIKKGDLENSIDKGFWNRVRANVTKTILNDSVAVYSYSMRSRQELDLYLNLLMKLGINFNVFER